MKRFALGLGIGFILGLASVGIMLAFLFHVPNSIAGAAATPTLLFENERVRAWSLTLEPGQSTSVHTHELDEIVIRLEGGTLHLVKAGQESSPDIVQPKFGAVFMLKVKRRDSHAHECRRDTLP